MRARRTDPPLTSVQAGDPPLQGFEGTIANDFRQLHRRNWSVCSYREDTAQNLGDERAKDHADHVVDEMTKQLLQMGLAGLVIIALVIDRRSLVADRKAAETKCDQQAERHRQEMEAFHQRHEAKAENWASHLSDLAVKNQENDAKIIAILESVRSAIMKKRGGSSEG
jgi:hypothetical protein